MTNSSKIKKKTYRTLIPTLLLVTFHSHLFSLPPRKSYGFDFSNDLTCQYGFVYQNFVNQNQYLFFNTLFDSQDIGSSSAKQYFLDTYIGAAADYTSKPISIETAGRNQSLERHSSFGLIISKSFQKYPENSFSEHFIPKESYLHSHWRLMHSLTNNYQRPYFHNTDINITTHYAIETESFHNLRLSHDLNQTFSLESRLSPRFHALFELTTNYRTFLTVSASI